MKPLYLLACLLFLGRFSAFGQCPPGNLTLSTQAMVASFQADYPGCTAISGNLTIFGADIDDLSELDVLTTISGNLEIISNPMLPNLTGLNTLTSVGGDLQIYNNGNGNLTSLTGLNALTSIGGELRIQGNAALTSLTGLNALTSVGGNLFIFTNAALTSLTGLNALTTVVGDLITIYDNDALTSLTGLNAITSVVGYLIIENNDALTSLTGLNALTSVGEDLEITFNAALTSLTGLNALTSVGGDLQIYNNGVLTSLTGLNALTSLVGYLQIQGNAALTSLAGLNALTSVGGALGIAYNNGLTSLTGLNALTSVGGDLLITTNAALTSLTGLNALTSVGGDLHILFNDALTSLTGLNNLVIPPTQAVNIVESPNLSGCAVQSICNYLDAGGSPVISNNATGCNNAAEITALCANTWDGSVGNWSNPAKWSYGIVPGAGAKAKIPAGTVTLDIVAPGATVQKFTLTGGTLTGGNDLTVTGPMDWSGGTVGGTGDLTVGGATAITNAPTLTSGTLTLNGGGTIAGGFNTSNGANLIVPMDKTLTCTANSDVAWGGNGGTVTLLGGTGTFVKNGAGVLECDFQNFQNTGTVTVSEGILRMGFGGTHNGAAFNLSSGTFLTLKGGLHTFMGCSFTGPGRLATILTGNVSTFSGNTVASNMGFNLVGESSTFNLGQDLNVNNFFLGNTQVVSGTGNLTVNGTTIIAGGTLGFTGNLTINGSLNWAGGMIDNGVHTTIPLGAAGTSSNAVVAKGPFLNKGTFTVQTGTLTANNSFVNGDSYAGDLIIKSGSTLEANGAFENGIGGIIKGGGTLDISGGTFTNTGFLSPGLSPGILTISSFDNTDPYFFVELAGLGGAGQLTGHDQLVVNSAVTLSGTLYISFLGGFENTIAVGNSFVIMTCSDGCSGNFDNINYPGANPNAWQIDVTTNPNEVRLVLAEGLNQCTWDGNTGDWSDHTKWSCGLVPSGSADVVINGGEVTLDNAYGIKTLTMNGGVLETDFNNFDLSLSAGLTMNGGLLNNGTMSVSGALTWSGGTIGGTGTMTVAGATNVSNTSATLSAKTLVCNNAFTNNGTISIESGTLDANSTFVNAANGILRGNGILDLAGATLPVTNTGTVAPGLSPGILTMTSFDNSNATFAIELAGLGGAGSVNGHDQLAVNSPVTLGGNGILNITFLPGFTPALNDEFNIMTCTGGCDGYFNTIVHPGNNPNAWGIYTTSFPTDQVVLYLAAPLSLLPLELLEFQAFAEGEKNRLTWRSASETDFSHYEIERSPDGKNWSNLSIVAGAGNATEERSYQFTDYQPMPLGYYRLRMMDLDGSEEFSNIVSVERQGQAGTVRISPNPFTDELEIKLDLREASTASFSLTDVAGRVVWQSSAEGAEGGNRLRFGFSMLPQGLYLLHIQASGWNVSERVVKM